MDVHLSETLDDCQQLEDSYQGMLNFMRNGGKDENSKYMRGRMIEDAMKLLVLAEREYRLKNENSWYVSKHQQLLSQGIDILKSAESLIFSEGAMRENELDNLFYAIWTSAPLCEEEVANIYKVLESGSLTEQCTITSSIGLSLIEYTDNQKLLILLSLLECETDIHIRARALAGLVISAIQNPGNMLLCQEFMNKWEQTLKREDIQRLLFHMNHSFHISQQTHDAMEKIQNQMLPYFKDMAKDGRIDIGIGLGEGGEFDIDIPNVPAQDHDKIAGMLHEFLQMQEDGVDMNAGPMIAMRNNEFFKELTHWFLPFDISRSEIKSLVGTEDKRIEEMLNKLCKITGGGDCDTDRYATAIMLSSQMSKRAKGALSKMMKPLSEGGSNEIIPSIIIDNDTKTVDNAKDICRRYFQQLYRVFNIWPHCEEWKNPFLQSANWLKNSILSIGLQDNSESLRNLANILIKYDNYSGAEGYLNRLVQLEGSNVQTLRNAAYCKQQQGKYGEALTLYNQADILAPEDIKTLEQMQLCYEHLERHEQRLDCLMQLEQVSPENEKYIIETGLCLMKLNRWQEASQRFYRLELEDKHIVASQRAIAWCSLHQGKLEQAQKYYNKLIDSTNVKWNDYLHAGHTAWAMGDTAKAVELYKGYIKRYLTDDPKITNSLAPFNEENDLLISLGKDQNDIDLMHDLLE